MVEILFARHGPTGWNQQSRYQGLNDQPILEETKELYGTYRIPKRYNDYRLFSSPLSRARQTMEAMGYKDYETIEELKECDFGEWEGLTYEQAVSDYPQAPGGYNGLDYKAHKGESYRDMQKRVIPWILSQKKSAFVMAHKALIMSVYAFATDWEMLKCPEHKLDYRKIQSFRVQQGQLFLNEPNIAFEQRDFV